MKFVLLGNKMYHIIELQKLLQKIVTKLKTICSRFITWIFISLTRDNDGSMLWKIRK